MSSNNDEYCVKFCCDEWFGNSDKHFTKYWKTFLNEINCEYKPFTS